MSLLLDALKKAAEKKAIKSSEQAETVDSTEVASNETFSVGQQEETALTETVALEHEATQFDDTALTEATLIDHEPTHLNEDIQHTDTEFEATSIENTEIETTGINSDTEFDYQVQLTGEDRTLIIADVDEQLQNEIDETTRAATTEIDTLIQSRQGKEEEHLTDDDVTQFMGDGHDNGGLSEFQQQAANKLKSDDTTLTNPESLTLTNFALTDDDQTEQADIQNLTESDTISLHGLDARVAADQTVTQSLNLRGTFDSTSTVSSIDIEKLTNDETVTVEGNLSTRTFAPDNYDRTLLNLSENDASKIFPGLRPESDTVMTPDYAKKVFKSKSSQVKTPYYKMYAGIGLLLLLAVLMWGMFELQQESELIDQRLVSLKHDPMPGIIKPQVEKASPKLFVTTDEESANKVIDIIAKADEPETDSVGSLEKSDSTEANISVADAEQSETGQQDETEVVSRPAPVEAETMERPLTKITSSQVNRAGPKSPASSALSISTRSQVSDKDLLLIEAYKAYEQGDMKSARSLYDNVLKQDKTSRDGLLGRAAIHVQDSEYQQAINKYQQLLVANPKDSMAMTSLISVANIDPQTGESKLKSLIREQPESPYLYFALGNMFGSQRRWSDAQNAYFDALQHKPDDPNYAYNLAVSLEHIGKTATARNYYQRALDNSSKGLVTFDSQLVIQRLEVLAQ